MQGYRIGCCDCGCVHDMEFRAVRVVRKTKGSGYYAEELPPEQFKVHFRVRRNNRSTAQIRRHEKIQVIRLAPENETEEKLDATTKVVVLRGQLADLMALKDWRFCIYENPPVNGGMASVEMLNGRKFAVIRFSEEFLNETAFEQRLAVAHELIHCLGAPLIRLLEINNCMGPATKLSLEYMTDAIADGWGPLLPLPSERIRSKP